MAFEELFDGEEHWLARDAWPGWTVPAILSGSLVKVVGPEVDSLESPDPGITFIEPEKRLAGFWADEDGWSAFSVMLQELSRLLEVEIDISQEVARDDKWNVTGKWHRVRMGLSFWEDAADSDSGYVAPEGL